MTTEVELKFDGLRVKASEQLQDATLLLHNDPEIKNVSDVIKLYTNTSQIVQVEVGRPQMMSYVYQLQL